MSKRGALPPVCRKEGDGNESAREKEEKKTSEGKRWLDRVKEYQREGIAGEEVYNQATWKRTSSTPHKLE